jgi:hypothetical protein
VTDSDQEPGRERLVLADRVHHYAAPIGLLFAALTVDQAKWLRLQPGEVEPRVLESVPNETIVWSSFWPVSPAGTIEFDLAPSGDGTSIRFRWFTASPPDDRGISINRQRLNRKFGGDLRAVVSAFYWSSRES